MILAFVIGLGATVAGALQPLLVARIADSFTGTLPRLSVLLLLGLLVSSALLSGLQELILQRTGERFAFDSRERLIRHVFALPIGTLEGRDRGDLVSRITTDVAQTRSILNAGLVELAINLVTVLVSIVMMALIDWLLLTLAALAILLVIVVVYVIGLRTRPAGLRLQNAVGDLSSIMSRSLGSMRSIRATVSTNREADSAVHRASTALAAGLATARLRAVVQTFAGVTVQLLLVSVVAVGALRVGSGALTVGQLSAFIMYLVLMLAPITTFASGVSMLGVAFGALSRILEIQSLDPERDIQDLSAPPFTPDAPDPDLALPVFELVNVSFRYPAATGDASGDTPWAVRSMTLGFAKGQTTAIVGPSGAGKSTLFALLERFHEPDEGKILFQGHDVARLSREMLRRQIAYVEQDAPALSGTVRDNLLLGLHTATEEQCLRALRRVNLLGPDEPGQGFLDSQVGEVGSRLSGGERQRLAIARAFVMDSPILLLDEVTSNLDSNNERVIQDTIRLKSGHQSVIVIAHRLSTVAAADSIVVIDDGRVVAQGTHGELLASSPLYRELAHTQLLG
jgi:ATP-binding cassette subfamily B protein